MAIQAEVVSVAASATPLSAAESGGSDRVSVLVKVPAGGVTVFVGPSGVTTASGFPVAAGESFEFPNLAADERLYGIVAAATQNVNVFRHGVG